MRVAVRFYGFIRDVVSHSSLALELPPGSTLRELLKSVVNQSGERLRDRLFTAGGELEANVQIFVGAEQAASLEQPIADGQEENEVKIFILSATAGG